MQSRPSEKTADAKLQKSPAAASNQVTLRLMPRDVAPQGTFDKMGFNQLLSQYDRSK
jgi:hypothetical protein